MRELLYKTLTNNVDKDKDHKDGQSTGGSGCCSAAHPERTLETMGPRCSLIGVVQVYFEAELVSLKAKAAVNGFGQRHVRPSVAKRPTKQLTPRTGHTFAVSILGNPCVLNFCWDECWHGVGCI